ncbi:MAG: hypothetical protein HXY38_09985 [Chloroflexi bacterium]|nr:hypothetical protein [Chloroflexota bacterium]
MTRKNLITTIVFIFFISACNNNVEPKQSIMTPTLVLSKTSTFNPLPTETFTLTVMPPMETITPTPKPDTIVFDLENGETFEMPRFETMEQALIYMVDDGALGSKNLLFGSNEGIELYEKLFKIKGLGDDVMKGIGVPLSGMGSTEPTNYVLPEYVMIMIYSVESGTILTYRDVEREHQAIFVNQVATDIYNGIDSNQYLLIPPTTESTNSTP